MNILLARYQNKGQIYIPIKLLSVLHPQVSNGFPEAFLIFENIYQ